MKMEIFEGHLNTFSGGSVYLILPKSVIQKYMKGSRKANVKILYEENTLFLDLNNRDELE